MIAIDNSAESIIIPVFGGGCGYDKLQTIAEMMFHEYEQIMNPLSDFSWKYACRCKPEKII